MLLKDGVDPSPPPPQHFFGRVDKKRDLTGVSTGLFHMSHETGLWCLCVAVSFGESYVYSTHVLAWFSKKVKMEQEERQECPNRQRGQAIPVSKDDPLRRIANVAVSAHVF